MAEAAAQALPAKVFEDDLIGTRKQECLRRIGRSLLGGQRLLPGGRRENAALWQKVAWFFQSGQWPKASLSKMRLEPAAIAGVAGLGGRCVLHCHAGDPLETGVAAWTGSKDAFRG